MSIAAHSKALTRDEHGIWVGAQSVAVNYPDSGNESCFELEDASFWFRHRNDCITAVVNRFPPGGTIVDVGGGNGFVARRLLDEGYDTAVLEPGPSGAFNAKTQRGIPEVFCCTLEEAEFRGGAIAAMGFFDVLEHIENDAALLSLAYSALRPGGLVYITVPAEAWLWSRRDEQVQHFRRYDRNRVKELLGDRFEVVYDTYFFAPLVIPVVLFRVLPYRLGVSRNREGLSHKTEHGARGGIAARVVARLLRREASKIGADKRMAFGTSYLCVARKRAECDTLDPSDKSANS